AAPLTKRLASARSCDLISVLAFITPVSTRVFKRSTATRKSRRTALLVPFRIRYRHCSRVAWSSPEGHGCEQNGCQNCTVVGRGDCRRRRQHVARRSPEQQIPARRTARLVARTTAGRTFRP